MEVYRTHYCNQLRASDTGHRVKLSGWVHRQRDHGSLLFIDLRDHYGLIQLIFTDSKLIESVRSINNESVITIEGIVTKRSTETINLELATGEIEIDVQSYNVESAARQLPFLINQEQEAPEDLRLSHRFLELRRDKLKQNILLRSRVIEHLRSSMLALGFNEIQTPILTASSPEGARDFLVPSRLHKGKFYALPQAPQQFKQLLMVAGFDRYFQIAPCFRDEDARADRSPGEFYQLDIEMSFVTMQQIFSTIESVLYDLFFKFAQGKKISPHPFVQLTYSQAMLLYGSDKPDLRNPLVISDLTEIFKSSDFITFTSAIAQGAVVRAIPAPQAANQPRKFFDQNIDFAKQEGAAGLAYLQLIPGGIKGPLAKFLCPEQVTAIMNITAAKIGDVVFFVCDRPTQAAKIAGKVRTRLAEALGLIERDSFHFCWVMDFPLYEWNEERQSLDLFHNPFSMPQGELSALENAKSREELLALTAYQYDIVCNGIELSSGAIRNHKPEVMYKAFELVGYSRQQVRDRFGAMIKAFEYGAPPHGGIAPGIDRIVMLLADAANLREVIAFPLTQQAEDLMMGAPAYVLEHQLKELHLK